MPRHARRAPIGLLSGLPLCKRGIEGDLFRWQRKIPPVPPLIKGGNVFFVAFGVWRPCRLCSAPSERHVWGCYGLRCRSYGAQEATSGVTRHEKSEALQSKKPCVARGDKRADTSVVRRTPGMFSLRCSVLLPPLVKPSLPGTLWECSRCNFSSERQSKLLVRDTGWGRQKYKFHCQ